GTKPAMCERVAIGVGPLEVVLHHVMATDHDLAADILGLISAFGVVNCHLVHADRAADGWEAAFRHPVAMGDVVQIDRKEAGVARRFREAVTVDDSFAERLVEALCQLYGQWSRATNDMPESRNVVLR